MFVSLSQHFAHLYSPLNVVHYISFRMIAALLTALFISLALGYSFINHYADIVKTTTREYTPASHKLKGAVPSMGGIVILITVFFTILLWCTLQPQVLLMAFCLLLFAIIGFWDDVQKIIAKKGILERYKFSAQIMAAAIVVGLWYWIVQPATTITMPFFKNISIDAGLFFIPWCMFVIIAMSNAVNLTDGLDGLVSGPLITNFATFTIIAYLAGHFGLANYLHIPFAGTAEIAVIGASLIGALIGFLWYNTYPAQMFMGDIGALSLGAGLGFMALMCKQELLLPISGILFLVETVSVIIQVFWVKLFKKRLFKMAPIHHHFELLGWPEPKISVRFGILTAVFCLLALLTLKIR